MVLLTRRTCFIALAIISIFLLSYFVAQDVYTINIDKQSANYKILTIDNFEKEGAWKVKFSKFRSLNWDPDIRERQEDAEWMTWVKADDSANTEFSRKKILPSVVYSMDKEKKLNSVLCVRAKWDYKGYNWFEIFPDSPRTMEQGTNKDALQSEHYRKNNKGKNYILLDGTTSEIRMWVWGMGYNYNIEIHLEDYKGNYYIIPGGKIRFFGWNLVSFKIPYQIKQYSLYLPFVRPLKLMKIRVVTDPNE